MFRAGFFPLAAPLRAGEAYEVGHPSALPGGGRSAGTLPGILEGPSEFRAEAIGRIYADHDGAALSELLIELERSEWARQWFIERLRQP